VSLSDRLQRESKKSLERYCKIGVLLYGNKLSKKDADTLKTILEIPEGTPGRVSNSALGKVFREENLDISTSTVDRHRRRECGCSLSVWSN
jgi:hypothetical protein